jgi:GT2 family glycosyltransferase
MSLLSIIIPTRERDKILIKSLDRLFGVCKELDAEILVVNDSDKPLSESTREYIQSKKARIIEAGGKGVAGARNLGVQECTSDIVLFMDDDVLVTGEAIDYLLSELKENPNTIINVNWSYPPELLAQLKSDYFGNFILNNHLYHLKGYRAGLVWKDNAPFEAEAFANYLVMIRKELFLRSGGYNQIFPFAGGEDTELSHRLHKMGVRFVIDPTITVYHNEEDRIELDNWLQRKYRSGMTIRAFQKLGYKDQFFILLSV